MTCLVLFELLQTYYCFSTNKKLLISWQFSGPYGVSKYSSGWRKDVINQCFTAWSWVMHTHENTLLAVLILLSLTYSRQNWASIILMTLIYGVLCCISLKKNQCICVKKECIIINYYDDAQVGRLVCPTPALLVIASINTHMQWHLSLVPQDFVPEAFQ